MESKQDLPAGWKWVKLGEVCGIIMGQSPPSSSYNKINEGLPFFQGKADFDTYFPKVRIWCFQPIKVVEEGTILISVRAPVGPVNISNTKCCIGRGLAGIRMKEEKVFNWYIFWYLFSKEHEIASIGSGSTFSAIPKDDLANLIVPLPPLSEQKRIAEKLKILMGEIDEARVSCEKQLEAAKSLPSAYLREVFESPESQKWEKKKLGEVIKLTQSGTWGDEPFEAPREEIFTVIRSTEVDHKGVISIKDEKVAQRRVKPETARKYFLKPNDLLIVRSGGTTGKIILGRVGIYLGEPNKYLFSNFLIKVQADENLVLPEFLWRYLNWDKFLEDNIPNLMRRTTGIQNLPMDEYFSIMIPLPPLPEQKRIAAYLKEKIDQAEKLRETLEKELETINSLPQTILSKAFQGEL